MNMSSEGKQLKEQGNHAFQNGDYELALKLYTDAMKAACSDTDKCVLHKNRAAVFLKLGKYQEAIEDSSLALNTSPNDPKALYRRCLALEKLGRYEDAYIDGRTILANDPSNKEIQPVLAKLHTLVQSRLDEKTMTENKARNMIDIAFDPAKDQQARTTALNNLIVLARDSGGANVFLCNNQNITAKIVHLLKNERDNEICIAAVRMLSELCKSSSEWTKNCVKEIGVPWFIDLLNTNVQERVDAAQHCIQAVINSLSGLENKLNSNPKKELCEQNHMEIDTILTCLTFCTTSRTLTGRGRDAIISIITRNVHYSALNWAERFVEIRGIARLMEVASELEEYKYESAMSITENTRHLVAVCLSTIYDNMYYDQAKEKFMKGADDFIREKLLESEMSGKVKAVVAITTLLRGPLDAGNQILAKEGIMEMVLVMANTEDVLQQKVSCECIIAASSKKDKTRSIINQGVDILKKLYNSKHDDIRVRALVGLCKLGASGGTDASIRPFADGAVLKLAQACRKFLVNRSSTGASDNDTKCWAAEGLSYLTLDADVKEKLTEDEAAIKALIDLAKSSDKRSVYSVVTIFVNLCNAYDKQEILPEMIELAKFAKHHIPEEHELDDPDFVQKRIETLGKAGITSALVELAKADESVNAKELIARVMNALCSLKDLRGIVVQQGGAKALLAMTSEGTEKGRIQAAQALARIGISINPEVAFPGQRVLELVRPLIKLLEPACSALETFEALLALCNVAAVSAPARKRILSEGGLQKIEIYLFEDHVMLRRAATQVLVNMTEEDDVVKLYEGENDKTKMMALLCFEEDEETVQAAAGVLAILTSKSEIVVGKLFTINNWLEVFHQLLANTNVEIQFRGIVIVQNILSTGKEFGQTLFETNIMEVLMALSKTSTHEKVKKSAEEALGLAENLNLIKKNVEVTGESETVRLADDPDMPELE